MLPEGEEESYMPSSDPGVPSEHALIGWRVLCFFDDSGDWHDGVVVGFEGTLAEGDGTAAWEVEAAYPYTIFYPEDGVHEGVSLPDESICMRRMGAGRHWIEVTRSMLPSV